MCIYKYIIYSYTNILIYSFTMFLNKYIYIIIIINLLFVHSTADALPSLPGCISSAGPGTWPPADIRAAFGRSARRGISDTARVGWPYKLVYKTH